MGDSAFSFFERRSKLGVVVMRVFLAFVLIYGTQDNIVSWARMLEFREVPEEHADLFGGAPRIQSCRGVAR